jgi:hypothetical protein
MNTNVHIHKHLNVFTYSEMCIYSQKHVTHAHETTHTATHMHTTNIYEAC